MLFVSYSSLDPAAVRTMVADLERANLVVWFDDALRGGDDWWAQVLARIRECDVFVFALSNASRDSKPCAAELDYALALGLPVLPVQVGPVDAVRALRIGARQIVPYVERDVPAAIALVTAVQERARERRPLPDPLPDPPPVPYAYLLRLGSEIDRRTLSPAEQAEIIRQLRDGLVDEHEPSVREDIRSLLRRLDRHPELTVRNAEEIRRALGDPARAARTEPRTDAPAVPAAGGTAATGAPRPSAPPAAATQPAAAAAPRASQPAVAPTAGSGVRPPAAIAPATTAPARSLPRAGWYTDRRESRLERYWDGARWTGRLRPAGEAVGWYPAPDGSGPPQYWDGRAWTDRPVSPTRRAAGRADGTARPGNGYSVAALVTGLLLFGVVGLVLSVVAHRRREPLAVLAIIVCTLMSGFWVLVLIGLATSDYETY